MKKTLIVLMLCLISFTVSAQKITKYFDYRWRECELAEARYLTVIEWKDSIWRRNDFFIIERKLQMQGSFTDSACKVAHGKFYYFHPNGEVSSMGRYVYGKKDGIWRSYYTDGTMEDSTVYSNGAPLGISLGFHRNGYLSDSSMMNLNGSGVYVSWFEDGTPASAGVFSAGRKKNGRWQYFHRNGKLSCEEVFDAGNIISRKYYNEAGEQMGDSTNTNKPASFPGGATAWRKFIGKHIYFPDNYRIINTNRVNVVVEATIDETGKVTDVEVVVPFHKDFNTIAVNAMKKSPKWEPAMQYGRKVKYKVSQTITFAQDDE